MSVLSVFALAQSSSPVRDHYTEQLEESCLDCSMPTPECPEPLCSSVSTLTTHCTNQCVVVACSDPDHEESLVCDKLGSCTEVADCTSCDGFEEFLQCCADYAALHPVPPQSQREFEPHLSHQPELTWDESFDDVWCNGCTTTNSTGFERRIDSILPQYTVIQNEIPGLQQRMYTPQPQDIHSQISMNTYNHSVPDESLPFRCMWGSCHSSFSAFPELISHVNLHHLGSSSSPAIPYAAPLEQIKTPTICKWADCTSQPAPSSSDDLLAYHLLHEHLGVNSTPSSRSSILLSKVNQVSQPTPLDIPSDFDTTMAQDSADSQILNTPVDESTSSSQDDGHHSCNGVNECKWKGCGLPFSTCAELTTHITAAHIGSGHAQYECFWDSCSRNGARGFQSKQKICRHVQSHTGHRPFQCTTCQQYFSEAATLQQHIRRHTQEKPYLCDFPTCGKAFAITGALTIHKRTHNGEKPFKCPHCDRGFAESSNLSKHLRTHTGARPYDCSEPTCGKAFARPDQLNRHKSVHQRRNQVVGSVGFNPGD